MTDYEKMWRSLGIDIESHYALLDVLGNFYKDIYLSQENRPKGTEYLDSAVSEIHSGLITGLVEARKEGRKVFGSFCTFVPEEFIFAANGINVGLCAGAEVGLEEAERLLPRNTCALIKSFMGFKLAKLSPYFETTDLAVGETTCDGKKKAYELLADIMPTYVIEVTQKKEESDRILWKKEVLKFKDKVEDITGVKITEENLAKAIKLLNDRRRALQRLNELRKAVPSVISGRDSVLINQIAFDENPERFNKNIGALNEELARRVEQKDGIAPANTPRLMISGCPMAVPNWKVPFIIESSGAVIVVEESCIGTRNTRDLVREDGKILDEMIDNIIDRYFKIDCACFTPNEERIEHIIELAKEFKVDGVVHYSLQFCSPYTIEVTKVERALEKEGIPLLKIETDYSMEDMEILKNRIDAFLGILR